MSPEEFVWWTSPERREWRRLRVRWQSRRPRLWQHPEIPLCGCRPTSRDCEIPVSLQTSRQESITRNEEYFRELRIAMESKIKQRLSTKVIHKRRCEISKTARSAITPKTTV